MVLEATLMVLDNSEWMRNGDYTPSRLEAQSDAVNLIFGSKTQSNPENTVGLMTMAGNGPEVLVTLTSDIGKILTAMHGIKISGKGNLTNGIQIAQLALKHRQNKNHAQRVIVFVGSPVEAEEKELVRLAKKLKKNNVAVDIINFGEEAENTGKLEVFIDAVKSGENSHLVTIPPGPHILSDILISTPIISGEGGAPAGFVSNGAGGYEFGIDPNLDPELALALRISMEEERARQETLSKAGEKDDAGLTDMAIDQGGSSSGGAGGEEDDMLAQALAMSKGEGGQNQDVHMQDLTEEEQIARAIQMSVGGGGQASSTGTNAEVLASVLGSLPGVDQNDPRIQSALKGDKEKEKKEEK